MSRGQSSVVSYSSLVGRCAFYQQALQFGFRLGADAVGESIGALPMLGAELGQAHMQVGLVLFQAAQQPLGSGDSFFQCNHAGEVRHASLHCHSDGRAQVTNWMPGRGHFKKCFSGKSERAIG